MKVLVATDGSEYSQRALARLSEFLPPSTSEVLLALVMPSPDAGALGLIGPPYIDYATLADQMRTEAQRILSSSAQILESQGLKPRQIFREGDPANEILDLARDEGVGLIVVGSHGRKGVRRFLLGSVSMRIVTHAPCSVLVVKHPQPS